MEYPIKFIDNMNPIAEKMYAKRQADGNTRVRVGVGVIVRDSQGCILLEKRSDCSTWGLPGGKIEPGESAMDAFEKSKKKQV